MADIETKPMVEVKLPAALVEAAKAAGIDPAETCEGALAYAVHRRARARKWQDENAGAIDAHNARIESEGLLMDRYFPA